MGQGADGPKKGHDEERGRVQERKGPVRWRPDEADSELEVACRRHLEFIRKNCPGLLPEDDLPAGSPAKPLPVEPEQATALVRAAVEDAVRARSGRRVTDSAPDLVVWVDGADSLLLVVDSIRVSTGEGLVSVDVDVLCDQLRAETGEPRARVRIDLVVGTAARPTGLLAAATTPHGPAVVVDRWHDALVALAWQALLDAAATLSAMAGSDSDGAGLIPTRWTASKAGLTIGPQARHPFDRARATSSRIAPEQTTAATSALR